MKRLSWLLGQLVTCYSEVGGQVKLNQCEPKLDLANVTVYSLGSDEDPDTLTLCIS